MNSDDTLLDAVRDEVVALHDAFVAWYRAELPDTDDAFHTHIGHRFSSAFAMVVPDGEVLVHEPLMDALRRGHGGSPAFEIEIRAVAILAASADSVTVRYEEWQRGSRAAPQGETARHSTAVLDRTPEGLRWRWVHETRFSPSRS